MDSLNPRNQLGFRLDNPDDDSFLENFLQILSLLDPVAETSFAQGPAEFSSAPATLGLNDTVLISRPQSPQLPSLEISRNEVGEKETGLGESEVTKMDDIFLDVDYGNMYQECEVLRDQTCNDCVESMGLMLNGSIDDLELCCKEDPLFTNFLQELSPVEPANTFIPKRRADFNSPPFVFQPPLVNSQRKPVASNRHQYPQLPCSGIVMDDKGVDGIIPSGSDAKMAVDRFSYVNQHNKYQQCEAFIYPAIQHHAVNSGGLQIRETLSIPAAKILSPSYATDHQMLARLGSLESSNLGTSETVGNMGTFNVPKRASSSHSTGLNLSTPYGQSGTGLHHNRMILQLTRDGTATQNKVLEQSYKGVRGLKADGEWCEAIAFKADGEWCEVIAASSGALKFPITTQPLNMPEGTGHSVIREDKKLFQEHVEHSSKQNARKKRRIASSTNNVDGSKPCTCKKSGCLKLYCKCFAARRHCTENCACTGCFNWICYDDKIKMARERNQSRYSHAFASELDETKSTPSTATCNKFCSCRKSFCEKNYCICYQAHLGCSNECRCEGCKNVYGRKNKLFYDERLGQ